jgi:FAD/FMN-containing dehydrogenase
VQLRGLGGEMARKEAGSTAFSHRDKPYMVASITIWTEKDQSDTHEAFGENFWQAIAPYHSGVYVGFLGEEGEERARSAYSEETYHRLAQIKARYDPENLFHLNHNIQPAAGD